MNLKEIKRLIALVEEANITQFSVETDGMKVKISKQGPPVAPVVHPEKTNGAQSHTHIIPTPQANIQEVPQDATPQAPSDTDNLVPIKAEMVGTFYSASSPDAKPFVSEGTQINKGDVICIIEAMKLFNEIEADMSGTVKKVLVKNGDPVEYGQDLFLIDPS